MAVDYQTIAKPPPQTQLATAFRRRVRQRTFFLLRRRRNNKIPTVRLGGKKQRRRLGIFMVKVLKKMRLRWLKLQYTCMLRKIKEYYRNLIKEIVEAGSTVEALQQRTFMDSAFSVPVRGISFSSFPSAIGSDRPSSLLF